MKKKENGIEMCVWVCVCVTNENGFHFSFDNPNINCRQNSNLFPIYCLCVLVSIIKSVWWLVWKIRRTGGKIFIRKSNVKNIFFF